LARVPYIFEFRQLKRSLKAKSDPIGDRMDELAREMTMLKTDDPRRAEVVQNVMRLRDLL
jgi:hypothetical protein